MKRQLFFKLSINILISVFIVWAISCAVNPVTKKREFMLITEADEIAMGKQSDAQVIQTYGVYDDANLNNYINSLGQKMAKLSHRPNLSFSFKVLDSPVINAFAVPGGFVYFTRGILGYLNNEAELAGVMGHEIGHITARHSAKQYSTAQVTQLGLGLGATLSETFAKYAGYAQYGVGMLFLKFSRDNERQADQLGVEYSTKAGYDSNYMGTFFETLMRLNPGADQSGLPGWFSTHPNPPDRVAAVKRDTKEWQAKVSQTKFATNRNAFLKKIDGIIYGPDPRQGYVEGNVFYHPMLKFQFPVPGGWKVNNTPSQVQMFTEQQDAVILFSMTSESTPFAAADNFITNAKATVQKNESIKVNGLTAQRINSEITSENATMRVLSYFIKKGNKVYVFHGYTTSEKFSGYSTAFQQTMGKFKNLTDQRKINVQPARLRIKKTTKRSTLRQAFQQFGVPQNKMEDMAILNGLQLNGTVNANALIKVVGK